MKRFLSTALSAATLTATAASSALAQGGCVGRVLLPPVETTRSERVLEAPARSERLYSPPVVERRSHQVMVRPEREERRAVPALYRVERTSALQPGPLRWSREPDRYADVDDQVVVAPGHYVWERRRGPVVSGAPQPGQTIVSPTGLVLCRVWCPARYETVRRRVRVGAGRWVGVRTAVRHDMVRRILVRPAGVITREVPAEYRWVSTARVVAPGGWDVRRTAARYGLRVERETRDGGSAYAPVVCGGPLSRPAMARLQSSLSAQGYDPGPADGLGRPQTYAALHRFQVDHRLAAGQVTVESARALGVVP